MAELTHSQGRRRGRRLRASVLVRIAAIASNTFVESIRQPVFAIVVGVAVALIALSPLFTMFTLMNAEKFIADMGLATVLLAGLLLAAFSASNVISEEIENKTVLTVISKPVGRIQFILGKYLGIAAALTMATYILTLILVLTVGAGGPESTEQEIRWVVVGGIIAAFAVTAIAAAFVNFFGDRPFPSSAMIGAVPVFTICFIIFMFARVKATDVSKPMIIDLQVIYAAAMVLWALLIMAAVAVVASTRLHVVTNVVLCSTVFLLGLLSQHLFGLTEEHVVLRGDRLSRSFQIEVGESVVIGSGEDADIRIPDAGTGLSPEHCSIARTEDAYVLRDMSGVRGGAWINGLRVSAARLAQHDRVQIGGIEFEYRLRLTAKNWAARIAYAVVPDLQAFWAAEALAAAAEPQAVQKYRDNPDPFAPEEGKARTDPISFRYVLVSARYAFFYIGALLFLAMAFFQDRQVS